MAKINAHMPQTLRMCNCRIPFGVVNVTVPYGSGERPLIRGYPRGNIASALKAFPQSSCCSCMSMLLRLHHLLRSKIPSSSVVVMLRRPRQLLSAFYAGLLKTRKNHYWRRCRGGSTFFRLASEIGPINKKQVQLQDMTPIEVVEDAQKKVSNGNRAPGEC